MRIFLPSRCVITNFNPVNAWRRLISHLYIKSAPFRLKSLCASKYTSNTTSPFSISGYWSPSSFNVYLCPSGTPLSISKFFFTLIYFTFWALHSLHLSLMMNPSPWHWSHSCWVCKTIPTMRFITILTPFPPQPGQVVFALGSFEPFPLHLGHIILFSYSTDLVAPL